LKFDEVFISRHENQVVEKSISKNKKTLTPLWISGAYLVLILVELEGLEPSTF
jgi:hypothetical protein